ncbi:MAG: hypothetical protein L6Q35_15135 [Phycisphaerales bacterium]|nr:hypothetical protein [Phycisphaerales bacterium]
MKRNDERAAVLGAASLRDERVDSAVESLASARWMHEPDWGRFKEKLMQTQKTRFGFIRQRPMFFGAVALAAAASTLVAGYAAYQVYYVEGTMRLDDGTEVPFQGTVVTDEGGYNSVEMSVDASGSSAGGVATFTLEDGRVVTLNKVEEAGKTDEKSDEKKPEGDGSPK